MAANPMQKKARNSFLAGMMLTFIVCLIIGALLYLFVLQNDKAKEKEDGALTYVYRLKTDIKSGIDITQEDVESVLVRSKVVPEGSFPSKIENKAKGGVLEDTIFPVGYKSKLDLKAGTILCSNLVYMKEPTADDSRYVEYNMVSLPTNVGVGSYIDIRLMLPNGQDLIVISRKEIKALTGDTIRLQLSEGEILMMESAIVEAYIMKAAKIYAVQYVEPGNQKAATKTYTPTVAVQELIGSKANNIVDEAKKALQDKFSATVRNSIDNEKSAYQGDIKENIEAGIQKQIEDAKKAREQYLVNLQGNTVTSNV